MKTMRFWRAVFSLPEVLVVCFIALCNSFPQAGSEGLAPPIEILKVKWEKQMRLPRDFEPSTGSPGSISDPTRSSSGRGAGGGGAGGEATTQGMAPSTPSRLSFVYVYSIKVKNSGPKSIEGVAWDYVFLDPASRAEIARHQFLSFEKVQPERSATFETEQRLPPIPILPAGGNDKHPKPLEAAVIQCVLYADGTTWRNSNTPEPVCDLLKKGKAGLSRKRSTDRP